MQHSPYGQLLAVTARKKSGLFHTDEAQAVVVCDDLTVSGPFPAVPAVLYTQCTGLLPGAP
jgi:hypothetical protein